MPVNVFVVARMNTATLSTKKDFTISILFSCIHRGIPSLASSEASREERPDKERSREDAADGDNVEH